MTPLEVAVALTVALAVALFLAFYLRFGYEIPAGYLRNFWIWLPEVLLVKIALLTLHRLYSVNWRFFGIMGLAVLTKII